MKKQSRKGGKKTDEREKEKIEARCKKERKKKIDK